jgi:hypothetical protein
MKGYIKIHRQVIENGWLKIHSLWILWSYLLLKASHTTHSQKVSVKRNSGTITEEVLLKPGQLIFGRKKAAEDTRLSEQNIRTALKHLKCLKNITVKSTSNYSIITIVNWEHYQTNSENQPTLNQHLTTNKKVKNILIELAFSLIESVKKESSVYSIINKYKNELGEDKLKEILSDILRRNKSFANENKLAAYLQTCKQQNGKSNNENELSFNPVRIYEQNRN